MMSRAEQSWPDDQVIDLSELPLEFESLRDDELLPVPDGRLPEDVDIVIALGRQTEQLRGGLERCA